MIERAGRSHHQPAGGEVMDLTQADKQYWLCIAVNSGDKEGVLDRLRQGATPNGEGTIGWAGEAHFVHTGHTAPYALCDPDTTLARQAAREALKRGSRAIHNGAQLEGRQFCVQEQCTRRK